MAKDKTFKISREYHDKLCRIRDQGRYGNLKNTVEILIDHWWENYTDEVTDRHDGSGLL